MKIASYSPAERKKAFSAILQRRHGSTIAWTAALVAATSAAAYLAVLPRADANSMSLTGAGRSFLALLSDRSPGERTVAELTKLKRRAAAHPAPKQRALAKIHKPALPPEVLKQLLAPPPELADLLLLPPPTEAFTAFAEPPPPDTLIVPPADSVPPIGGGGGGGGGGGTQPPEQPPTSEPPTVSAVPEPGTWATMLFGFGLMGWAMRRQNRNAARLALR